MQPICLLQQAPTTPFVTSLSESRREGGKGGVLSPLINSEISPITSSPCSLAIAAPAQTSISETDFTASNPRELEFSQGPSQEMELSWQGYYNPSRLWEDNRMIQVNGEVPAFSLQDSLWIEGPTLEETLEPDEEEIKEAFGSEASDGRAKQGVAPILENPALKGKLPWFKSGFKCGVHVDVSKEQLQDHVSFWDTLSLEEALSLLDQTDELPLIDSSVCILQKSRKKKNLVFAKRAHAHVCHNGLEAHAIVGNYIVPMFVECGSVVNAQQVFNRLVHRNEHTWTSLVLGYIQSGKLRHALDLYEEMMEDNVHPSSYTLVALVQACAKLKDVRRGAELHVEITQLGLERDPFVGSSLIDLYGKCGLLPEARDVFEEQPVRGIVSWNALIAGYAEHGASQEVLKCIQQMQLEDITPDAVTYSCSLKACGSMGNIEKVQQLHIEIAQDGFETDLPVGNSMIGMYAKCGSLSEAQEVFDTLPARDVVSWNALITGYAEHGPVLEALNFFEKMSLEGISPNAATFACTLRACGGVGTLGKGQEIHSEIVQKGLERDLSVGNSLVGMYTKFGLFSEAEKVFGKMLIRDAVSWTALIAGYAEHGADQESLKHFEQMQLEGLSPDAVTYTCILKACGNIGAVDRGRELCREIACKGFKRDLRVGNSLIGMYVKCGLLSEAREIFDEMPVRNVVSWTTLITGYADNGAGQEGLQLFKQMQLDGVSPNDVTLAAAFKSCGSIGALDKGQEIHAQVAQDGYERDELVCSSLVCMYAKCGLLSEAGELIDVSPIQNIVSWNALLSGYAEHGPGKEALQWFEKMQEEGVFPDAVTYSCILKACASVGAIDIGRELHRDILQRGLERDSSLGNSLISMYSKCGSLSEAQEIFDTLAVQDVVAWSSMIIGYGVNHEGKMALQCFDDMQEQGVKPDSITFTRLLTACSHAGLVLEGQEYLKIMREDYGIPPTVEHFTSMVDLLARSGHLYEAEMFIEKLCPYSEVTWGALLSACKTYGEAELGLRCFHQLVEINSKAAAWYVLMADIHAGAGSWDSAYRIEELRKHAGTRKKPGSALIEVNKKAYEFIAGNNQSKEVLDRLTLLSSRLKEEGHRPHLALVLKPISDEEKEVALCEHAEKLAIAFGLVNTPQGETLRLTKNLRMCNDCHDASKIISRIERREIILRDECCMHHFKDGACSCGDMF